ncbi:MAG: hypothetical protein WD708_01790 [Kiritimatiellia bacterium]
MSKFRLFLFILLLAAAGYWLWHHFQQPTGSREFRFRPDRIPAVENVENLPPYELLVHSVSQSINRLHSPLDEEVKTESENLKRLWNLAREEHQRGNLTSEEAREISGKLTELIRMNEERQKMTARFLDIKQQNYTRFESNSQLTDEDRQAFARRELLRQWDEWKIQNQRRLQ